MGDLGFFDDGDVALPELREVVGDRAADRAAADDYGLKPQTLAPAASVFTYQRTNASTLYSLYFEYGPGS
jgi:hypothetical protein